MGSENWRSWEGRTVEGKFPLRQWLGGSSDGAVFVTERSGQKAAIKLIAVPVAGPDRHLSIWRAAAKLSHPHLMPVFECGSARVEGTPVLYVVTECADEDLSQILPTRALAPGEVAEMLPPLLEALAYLHGQGFVHARIKPSNVLAVGEQLKLSADDAMIAAQSDGLVKHRDVFDAPETAAGAVSPAADMWSLGATLVAALTQHAPSGGDASAASDPAVPASVPEPFRGIARECLHVDPKRRCSISDIQARLQPDRRSVPEPAHVPVKTTPERHNDASFGRPILILAVVLVALVAGVRLFHRKPSQSAPIAAAPAQVEPAAPKAAPAVEAPKPAPTANIKGEVAHQVVPDIPPSAKNTITGTIKVAVRVDVDTSGKVTNAKLTTSGPSKYFSGQALNAARRWEFVPPQVNGQPAPSAWMLRFRFKRTSTQASADHAK